MNDALMNYPSLLITKDQLKLFVLQFILISGIILFSEEQKHVVLFLYIIAIAIFFSPALSSETIIIGEKSKPSVEVNLEAIDNTSPQNLRNLTHIKSKKDP